MITKLVAFLNARGSQVSLQKIADVISNVVELSAISDKLSADSPADDDAIRLKMVTGQLKAMVPGAPWSVFDNEAETTLLEYTNTRIAAAEGKTREIEQQALQRSRNAINECVASLQPLASGWSGGESWKAGMAPASTFDEWTQCAKDRLWTGTPTQVEQAAPFETELRNLLAEDQKLRSRAGEVIDEERDYEKELALIRKTVLTRIESKLIFYCSTVRNTEQLREHVVPVVRELRANGMKEKEQLEKAVFMATYAALKAK